MKNIVAQREKRLSLNETKCSLSLRKFKVSDLEKYHLLTRKNTPLRWKTPSRNEKILYLNEKKKIHISIKKCISVKKMASLN